MDDATGRAWGAVLALVQEELKESRTRSRDRDDFDEDTDLIDRRDLDVPETVARMADIIIRWDLDNPSTEATSRRTDILNRRDLDDLIMKMITVAIMCMLT